MGKWRVIEKREGRVCVYICVCSGVKEYVFSGRREKDRGIEFVCLCLWRERYYFEETRSYSLFVCKLWGVTCWCWSRHVCLVCARWCTLPVLLPLFLEKRNGDPYSAHLYFLFVSPLLSSPLFYLFSIFYYYERIHFESVFRCFKINIILHFTKSTLVKNPANISSEERGKPCFLQGKNHP